MTKTLQESIHDGMFQYCVWLKSPRNAVRKVFVDATTESVARGLANEQIGWRYDVIKCVRSIDL